MTELVHCSLITAILLIWFKSSAFVEYAKLFKVHFYFYIPDFEMKQEKDAELSYLDYLAIEHDCFFTRLITCVMCLGFWITLIVCMSTGKLHNIPLYYVGSLVAYGLTFKILEE